MNDLIFISSTTRRYRTLLPAARPAADAMRIISSRRSLASGRGQWRWRLGESVLRNFWGGAAWACLGLASLVSILRPPIVPPPAFGAGAGAGAGATVALWALLGPGGLLAGCPGLAVRGRRLLSCEKKRGPPPAETNPSPPDPGLPTPSETVPVRDRESSDDDAGLAHRSPYPPCSSLKQVVDSPQWSRIACRLVVVALSGLPCALEQAESAPFLGCPPGWCWGGPGLLAWWCFAGRLWDGPHPPRPILVMGRSCRPLGRDASRFSRPAEF